jgi:hypothetical protein
MIKSLDSIYMNITIDIFGENLFTLFNLHCNEDACRAHVSAYASS